MHKQQHACIHTCSYIHSYIHTYIIACIHTYIHTNYILTITGATDPFSLTGVLDAGAYKIVCGVSKAPTSSPTDLSYNYGYVAQPDYDDPGISPSPLPVPSPTMVPIASPTKAPTNTFSYRQRPTTYSTHKSKNFL